MENTFLSGFVSVTGRSNVGKSTLINAVVGEKLAIVSSKPQTTRGNIKAVLTMEDCQIVFTDTPGINTPKRKLDAYMQKSAGLALSGTDIILFLTEASVKFIKKDAAIIERFKSVKAPVFLVINKIDLIQDAALLPVIDDYKNLYDFAEVVPVSALTGGNLDTLIDVIKTHLPIGPKYFPEDYITDTPVKQIVAEIIREKALMLLKEEVPHGIAAEIVSFKEREEIIDIEAIIYCEKASHKGIIIGKGGGLLKRIGVLAREDIERLTDTQVCLKTWVKVKDNWRDSDYLLRAFGYDIKKL